MQPLSFVPSTERLALAASAARLVRERFETNAPRVFSNARWQEFAELGWFAAAISEANGGLGLPLSSWSVVAETLAPAAAVEPFSSQVAQVGYLLDNATASPLRDELLAAWIAASTFIVLADDEGQGAPWESTTRATRCRLEGKTCRLYGRKALVLDAGLAATYLVSATREDGQVVLFAVAADSAGLQSIDRRSIDARPHRELLLDDVVVPATAQLTFPSGMAPVLAGSTWLHSYMLAAEALGLLQAMLQTSHAYLLAREQFGRALIEFQVLQHRLVDMALTVTRLESLLDIARLKCDEWGPLRAAPYIAAAKAAIGGEGRTLARQAVQLHGAIGLTAELALGAQLRRLLALELLGGTSAMHEHFWAAHHRNLDQ
jgi:alkylation response protein AidB-like acyl-CoA dehydrogenase